MKKTLNKRRSLANKAEAALLDAAASAVSQARITRKPLVLWRNGRIVRLAANRLRLEGKE